VRGKGLMVAVDLVNGERNPITADQVKKIIKKLGADDVVMTKCGQSALRLAPALILTQEQADEAVDIMLNVLKRVSLEI
jgi:4-aminobutyrate aminotransferase-like enzyme